MGLAPIEGLAQLSTKLTFEALIYSKRIKPLLKREVNKETSFTSLKSYYEINVAYSLLYAVYILF